MEPDNQNTVEAKRPTTETPRPEPTKAHEPGVTKRPRVSVVVFRRVANWFFERHGVKTLTGSPVDHFKNAERKASIVLFYVGARDKSGG